MLAGASFACSTGPASTNIMTPAGAGQLGTAMPNRRSVEPLQKGTAAQVRSGNEMAASTVGDSPSDHRAKVLERSCRLQWSITPQDRFNDAVHIPAVKVR